MLRITIVCLIAIIFQASALPEYIENLERDLASLPAKYQHIADDFRSKRAENDGKDSNAYCCKNWQYINKDEIFTKAQTVLVPQTITVIEGYKDCDGNINPNRPTGPINTANGCTWVPVNKTITHMAVELITVTYLVPNSYTYCAPEDYHCCPGFIMLNSNCVHESAVSGLEFLIQLGLIGGIGKK